jgi:hypothetical protein
MYSPTRDALPSRVPTWLSDTGGLASYTALMAMGGFQLAEAMIEELLRYAREELSLSDTAHAAGFPPGLSHDHVYEANLRRIKALELTLASLRVAHAHPGLVESLSHR